MNDYVILKKNRFFFTTSTLRSQLTEPLIYIKTSKLENRHWVTVVNDILFLANLLQIYKCAMKSFKSSIEFTLSCLGTRLTSVYWSTSTQFHLVIDACSILNNVKSILFNVRKKIELMQRKQKIEICSLLLFSQHNEDDFILYTKRTNIFHLFLSSKVADHTDEFLSLYVYDWLATQTLPLKMPIVSAFWRTNTSQLRHGFLFWYWF